MRHFVKLGAVAALGLAISGQAVGKGANPNGKPFVELQGQIVEVQGELSSLQDQIDSLVGRVDSVEAEQAALSSSILDLQATNQALQDQILLNQGDIASIEYQIGVLQVQNTDLQAQIDNYGDTTGALQTQITANQDQITTLTLALNTLEGSLQSTIDNNSSLIAIMQGEIDALQAEIDMKQNVINGFCPNGSSIRQVFPNGSVACETDDTGAATGTGTLSAYYTYGTAYVPAGHHAYITTYCASGYMPISVGYSAYDMQVFGMMAYPQAGYPATLSVRNTSGYDRNAYAYVNCLRVQN